MTRFAISQHGPKCGFQLVGLSIIVLCVKYGRSIFLLNYITGCGKSRSFYCINYRRKESELLGLPLCVLCFSIFSVVLSIEHFQFALIHFLRLDSSHVILNVFNSHVRAPSVGRVRSHSGTNERERRRETNGREMRGMGTIDSIVSPNDPTGTAA